MNGKYRLESQVILAVMKQMGISLSDIYRNIARVNNELLMGNPVTVKDVRFKANGDGTFIATRISDKGKKKGTICWIDISKAFHSHNILAKEADIKYTIDMLDTDNNITHGGLKFKVGADKTFRVYDVRRVIA